MSFFSGDGGVSGGNGPGGEAVVSDERAGTDDDAVGDCLVAESEALGGDPDIIADGQRAWVLGLAWIVVVTGDAVDDAVLADDRAFTHG